MIDPLSIGLAALAALLLLWALVRVINGEDNGLSLADLVSRRGLDGKQYASWDPIGKGVGVLLCAVLPTSYAFSDRADAGGIALILTVVLAYLGGVSGYAATLRARQGTTETTRVTEPSVADQMKTTVTKVETP